MDTTGGRWRLGHRPALDGLRGVAIALVLLCHGDVPGFAFAGITGVTMFFALSGFLITALLLEEHSRTHRINLPRFYFRRFLRLAPALVVCVTVVTAVTILTAGVFEPSMTFGALTYTMNWLAADGVVPQATPLGHTWSLAIEEQFYLVWPVLLLALLRLPRRWLRPILMTAVALVTVERLWLFASGSGLPRLYMGLDTRADSLLIGCLLAVAMHKSRERLPSFAMAALGVALVLITLRFNYLSAYLFSPAVVAIGTAVAILPAASGSGVRWLTYRPLMLLGQRSYAFYLWHAPVIAGLEELGDWGWVATLAVAVPVSWLLTVLSWRFVEEPFLKLKNRSDERPPATKTRLPRVVLYGARD